MLLKSVDLGLYLIFKIFSLQYYTYNVSVVQEENLSAMNTDPWYSAYHYSHPPLVERLAALDKSDKKAD